MSKAVAAAELALGLLSAHELEAGRQQAPQPRLLRPRTWTGCCAARRTYSDRLQRVSRLWSSCSGPRTVLQAAM
jgi:hypothetical protein